MEPTVYCWLIPNRLALAERPGGGGRTHRVARRDAQLAWWWDEGVRTIVSTMATRHGLLEAALAGFGIRWYPLREPAGDGPLLREFADGVAALLEAPSGPAVMVHCDLPGEWLAGIGAVLRRRLGLSPTIGDALADIARDGLPVGSVSVSLVSAMEEGLRPITVATR